MDISISKETVFTPDFNGNKKLPSTDQITVRYRVPTMAIKNRCRKKPQAKGIAEANGSIKNIEVVIEKDDLNTLNEMLISISNCSYSEKGGKSHVISSAQDLLDAPVVFEPLLKEIVAEFDRALDHSRPDEKN